MRLEAEREAVESHATQLAEELARVEPLHLRLHAYLNCGHARRVDRAVAPDDALG
jgi:hypothetical protein